jgi:hypothetical protein
MGGATFARDDSRMLAGFHQRLGARIILGLALIFIDPGARR